MKNLFTFMLAIAAFSYPSFAGDYDNGAQENLTIMQQQMANTSTSDGIFDIIFGKGNKHNSYPTQHQHNNYNRNPYYTNYGNNHGYGNNKANFNRLLQVLKEESFDSRRVNTAKDYVARGRISAQEIAKICQLFTFDSYRLDFAKYAYANCTDKRNYFLLRDVFTFSSNYNELIDYTRNW